MFLPLQKSGLVIYQMIIYLIFIFLRLSKLQTNVPPVTIVQSHLVFDNVMKTLVQKRYLYIVHGAFFLKCFSWTLFFKRDHFRMLHSKVTLIFEE